jgi:putative RNA 2'-phosphotransferase
MDRALFEADDEVIRVRERRWDLDPEQSCPSVPKILFTPVRRRAHPHVMEKGLQSPDGSFLVFTSDKEMALRIGRRRDPEPVILEVMGPRAHRGGSRFFSFGELYLIREVAADCISGPAVPKESLKREGTFKQEKLKPPPPVDAGSFILDPGRDPDPSRRAGKRKHRGWKEDARKMRRRKNR